MTVRQSWDNNTSNTSVVYAADVYLARITAAIVGVTGVVNATNVQLNGAAQRPDTHGDRHDSAGADTGDGDAHMNPIQLDYSICKYIPAWYKPVEEYQQICQTESAQLQTLAAAIHAVKENFYFPNNDTGWHRGNGRVCCTSFPTRQ